jgi:hypothetical protein
MSAASAGRAGSVSPMWTISHASSSVAADGGIARARMKRTSVAVPSAPPRAREDTNEEAGMYAVARSYAGKTDLIAGMRERSR